MRISAPLQLGSPSTQPRWQGCRRAAAISALPFPAGVSEGTDWLGVIWALTDHPFLRAFTEASAQLFCPDFHLQPSSNFKMIKKDSGTRPRVSKGLDSAIGWGWMQWQSARSWEHPTPASKPALTQTRHLLASRARKHSQVWCQAMSLHRVIKWKNQLSEPSLFWSFVSFPLWLSCAPLFTSLTRVNFSLKLIWYEQSSSRNSRNIFSSFFQMPFLPSFLQTNCVFQWQETASAYSRRACNKKLSAIMTGEFFK